MDTLPKSRLSRAKRNPYLVINDCTSCWPSFSQFWIAFRSIFSSNLASFSELRAVLSWGSILVWATSLEVIWMSTLFDIIMKLTYMSSCLLTLCINQILRCQHMGYYISSSHLCYDCNRFGNNVPPCKIVRSHSHMARSWFEIGITCYCSNWIWILLFGCFSNSIHILLMPPDFRKSLHIYCFKSWYFHSFGQFNSPFYLIQGKGFVIFCSRLCWFTGQ